MDQSLTAKQIRKTFLDFFIQKVGWVIGRVGISMRDGWGIRTGNGLRVYLVIGERVVSGRN